MQRWPTVADLASADLDEVLQEWSGLGYYARARNLHKCAGVVVADFGGHFPDDEAVLKSLPGVGDYTAAAIAAIAFDQPATIVDGNVERVISRLFQIDEPLPGAKKAIKAQATRLTPKTRPGDYAQAIMDLGATICSPRKPACSLCPWQNRCQAAAIGDQETYPVKAPKKQRPTRRAVVYWLQRQGEQGPEVWMRRRPEKGLLGGMMEFPSSDWREGKAEPNPPIDADWQPVDGRVVHIFTHFRLELDVEQAGAGSQSPEGGQWIRIDRLAEIALPTVMKKVNDLVRENSRKA